jgi:hypothetical protein
MEPENKKLKQDHCDFCSLYHYDLCNSLLIHNTTKIIINQLCTENLIKESLNISYDDNSIILINTKENFIYFNNKYIVITKYNNRYIFFIVANKKLSIDDIMYNNVLQNIRYTEFDEIPNHLDEDFNLYIIADSHNKYYLHKLIRYYDINNIEYKTLFEILDNDYIYDERKLLYYFISQESLLYYYD